MSYGEHTGLHSYLSWWLALACQFGGLCHPVCVGPDSNVGQLQHPATEVNMCLGPDSGLGQLVHPASELNMCQMQVPDVMLAMQYADPPCIGIPPPGAGRATLLAAGWSIGMAPLQMCTCCQPRQWQQCGLRCPACGELQQLVQACCLSGLHCMSGAYYAEQAASAACGCMSVPHKATATARECAQHVCCRPAPAPVALQPHGGAC